MIFLVMFLFVFVLVSKCCLAEKNGIEDRLQDKGKDTAGMPAVPAACTVAGSAN